MKISIVIVNYNVQYFLEQCLLSVFNACNGLDAEVFVVDNNSPDGSVEMVRKKFPHAQLIANGDNKGFSAANNQAIRMAKGEYILLLNPDTVVEEDTFRKTCSFMDEHPDAGALGVQMIDGKGNFLPESKRGLPKPDVAFYKIFGLSALFPKSKLFGRYHLGFLDKNEVHKVDVLSGAFMLLRKSALDKTGLLDEDYFMYGEDIDLSYRIQKAGYHNYYFPHTRIIHYKGESTKKSSINYVFVFYRAMVIFARKHFAKGNAQLFSVLINIAIYIRAGAAILKRLSDRLLLPLLDALLIFISMYFLKNYWEFTVKDVHYPPLFMNVVVPLYIVTWLSSAFLSGGYDKPVRLSSLIRGVLSGAVFILVVYALLPETYRFSRALILLGTVIACIITCTLRILFHVSGYIKLAGTQQRRLIIVGDEEETQRILSLLQMSGTTSSFIGYVDPTSGDGSKGQLKDFYLGNSETLSDIVSLYEANEVIFCSRELSSQQIIQQMLQTSRMDVEYKIAPPESLYIIGSNSINEQGTLYFVDLHSIQQPANKRNKRILDIATSLVMLLFSPVLILLQSNKGGFLVNIYKVLSGKCSWVGLASTTSNLKKGILSPADGYPQVTIGVKQRLEALYAKEYRTSNDFRIILRSLNQLGRNPF